MQTLPLVLDGHNDLPWQVRLQVGGDLHRLDIAARARRRPRTSPGCGPAASARQFWSVYAPSDLPGDLAVTQTLEQVDLVYRLVQRYANDLTLAMTAAEVEAAMAAGRIASLMGAEGGGRRVLAGRPPRAVPPGVRYLTLTHNDNVPWADSATDMPVAGGLTRFGVEVVRR